MSGYTFASQPRAVAHTRKKYRLDDTTMISTVPNIMFDRRVVRGTTVKARATEKKEVTKTDKLISSFEAKRGKRQAEGNDPDRLVNPRDLPKASQFHKELKYERKRVELPLSQYLEAEEEEVKVRNEACQTDAFVPLPPRKPYLPMKTGLDVGTQVENSMVFDFDRDVDPILEVLMGKTLEQALMEVRQEEQVKALQARKHTLREIRQAEMVMIGKLEKKEKKLRAANVRVLERHRKEYKRKMEVEEKNKATAFAIRFLDGMEDRIFDELAAEKYFVDPVSSEIEQNFVPWMYNETRKNLKVFENGRGLVDKLLRACVAGRKRGLGKVIFMIEDSTSGENFKVVSLRILERMCL
ncbi:hypothetical protein AAMO2058_001712200 [Amorphochlora amoebiformis]